MSFAAEPKHMRRCLELAQSRIGYCSPNPMVGCVLVNEQGEVIAEGYHERCGAPHAERHALNKIDFAAKGLTAYVSLEPCSHHGRTPPCAEGLISAGVKRVVVACEDPFPPVRGKGVSTLEGAGIEVVFGLLEEQARFVNRRFFCSVEKKRPYITLKWAETADGFIAREDGSSKWISNESSRCAAHWFRHCNDAILVGGETLRRDNPSLNCRLAGEVSPLRILLSAREQYSSGRNFFTLDNNFLVYGSEANKESFSVDNFLQQGHGRDLLPSMLSELHTRNVRSLLVEGGTKVLSLFLEQGLWDEIRVFRSKEEFGSGIKAPEFSAQKLDIISFSDNELEIFSQKDAEMTFKELLKAEIEAPKPG